MREREREGNQCKYGIRKNGIDKENCNCKNYDFVCDRVKYALKGVRGKKNLMEFLILLGYFHGNIEALINSLNHHRMLLLPTFFSFLFFI